jgi:hypothetical protein
MGNTSSSVWCESLSPSAPPPSRHVQVSGQRSVIRHVCTSVVPSPRAMLWGRKIPWHRPRRGWRGDGHWWGGTTAHKQCKQQWGKGIGLAVIEKGSKDEKRGGRGVKCKKNMSCWHISY